VTRTVDAVVVGSGHQGLVAAAYLARAGWSVEVLERNERAGGTVATDELTRPGYRHDTFSCWHPLFRLSAAFAELGDELAERGLHYEETPEATTASVLGDGRAILAYRDGQQTAAGLDPRDRSAYLTELESFGRTIPVAGELLGTELHSAAALRLAARLGRRGGLQFAGEALSSARAWFDRRFDSDDVADLYAPWCLHTGMPPDAAGSGFQALAIAGSLHVAGLPVVSGGSTRFVEAFERLIADHGGRVTTRADVDRILVRNGRARGVVAGDEEIAARRAVIADVTPTQLYGRLLGNGAAPPEAVRQAGRFRYGRRAGMQIHVALSAPLRWKDARLDSVAIVHLTGGIDSVALASAQASAGLLPAEPTVVVGQPAVLDASRAPAGAGMLWIQLQDVPYHVRGDAAGQIDVGDGTWTPELVRAYVDRVLAKLEPVTENWPDARLDAVALSPAELERRDVNLVRGDIYSGDCELGQSFLWRPLPGFGSHATPVRGLYHCGASTFPGPGLNAASGRIVARRLLRRRPWRRGARR
jgi:phytoene dehydrogenase-like protein